ncbi:MAG: methyltransferase [Sulfurimonas sp. RIFOXYD12_FULL_36_11]|nr:MAG: methyltransferase [Sulfurimonas sp. RIFOXYD12_FULL_36_11]
MKISSEFSKYALEYNNYNVIQNSVIERILSKVGRKPKRILDLGCGSGTLCKTIDWEYEYFMGVDFAQGMLDLHPKSSKIDCLYGDFNDDILFERLFKEKYDFIFSSSALQWADDLEKVFFNIKQFNIPFALAIFTSNTFKTINQTASINSILESADEIYELQKKYFNAEFEVVEYKLEFESTRDMFRYIKRSGVSGARKILSYKESKDLLNNYPLNYLEFEVVFIYSR